MTSGQTEVTSTARSPLQLLIVFFFLFGAGFFFWVFTIITNPEDSILTMLLVFLSGMLPLVYGVVLFLEYKNRKLMVSEDGVTYTDRLGKTSTYSWDQVKARWESRRGWVVIFRLDGKRVLLGSQYKDLDKLSAWMDENNKWDKKFIEERWAGRKKR